METVLQKAEEGLELLVLAGTERPIATIFMPPAPQLHFGDNHLGRVLGFTNLIGGCDRWGGVGMGDLSSGITYSINCACPS